VAKDTVLNALMLLKAIHDNREAAGAVIPGPLQSKEIVLLAPMTLKQLNEAIEAERLRATAAEALELARMQSASVTVVVIRNNVVDESFLFQGPNGMIGASAEAKFRELVKDEGIDAEDMDGILDDGYWEFKDGNGSVCITWPTLAECTTTGKGIAARITGDGPGGSLVNFDAVPWFEQASDEEISELAAKGWGGDYEADAVAEFIDTPEIRAIIDKGAGFEVHIDGPQAMVWLADNRTNLYEELAEV
jgi:hypothetical protein